MDKVTEEEDQPTQQRGGWGGQDQWSQRQDTGWGGGGQRGGQDGGQTQRQDTGWGDGGQDGQQDGGQPQRQDATGGDGDGDGDGPDPQLTAWNAGSRGGPEIRQNGTTEDWEYFRNRPSYVTWLHLVDTGRER